MLKQLRRARARLLRNELLSQGANAMCAALAAFIVLLLAGAQALNWHWLLLLPAVAAAVGVWRARKRLPQPYPTAQLVDRRLNLADTLSTAFYFTQHDADPRSPGAQRLLEQADRLSKTLDLRKAAPYTMPRAAYPMLALLLIGASLFALRYAVSRRLDWNAPLAKLLQWNPFAPDRALAQNLTPRDPNTPAAKDEGDSAEPGGTGDDANHRTGKDAQDSANGEAKNSASSEGKRNSATAGQQRAEQPDRDEARDRAESAERAAGQAEAASGQGRPGDRSAQAGAQQSRSDSPGLMDRFKDAVQSLFSRSTQPGGEQPRQAGAAGRGQQSNAQATAKQRADTGMKGEGRQGSSQQGEADRMADAGESDDANGPGKSDPGGEKRAGNGIGSEDGDKALRQAEQLAAMGKISEIFGKRAATLTGQATVETQSATQQLRTPYEQRSGTHSDAGADIGRDEVPPALQAYVREYFAQIHKQRKK